MYVFLLQGSHKSRGAFFRDEYNRHRELHYYYTLNRLFSGATSQKSGGKAGAENLHPQKRNFVPSL